MNPTEEVDKTIHEIEQLYQKLTGRQAPPVGEQPYAPIPPERDPAKYVQEQLQGLREAISTTMPSAQAATAWKPPSCVLETPTAIFISIDLPGVSRDDVSLDIERDTLRISGRRQAPEVDTMQGHRLQWSETRYGSFQRVFPIPTGVEVDEIEAEMHDGILEVRLPRIEESGATKSIEIQ